jgi:hypothetical protein
MQSQLKEDYDCNKRQKQNAILNICSFSLFGTGAKTAGKNSHGTIAASKLADQWKLPRERKNGPKP